MNTSHTYSYYFLAIIALSSTLFAKKSNFTAGTRHLGRNSMVAVVNRQLDGYPFAQAVTATGYKVTEDYHKGNAAENEKFVRDSIKEQLPYFVINYGLRKSVQLSSSYGYTPNDIIQKCDIVPESFVKEIIQDTAGYITPVTQETAYDIATAVIITYVVPLIIEQFK